jgi:hypothetical protein
MIIIDYFLLFKSGEYRKDELLEAARSGNEEKLLSLLTSTNVNCHASDGRKVGQIEENHNHVLQFSVRVNPTTSRWYTKLIKKRSLRHLSYLFLAGYNRLTISKMLVEHGAGVL